MNNRARLGNLATPYGVRQHPDLSDKVREEVGNRLVEEAEEVDVLWLQPGSPEEERQIAKDTQLLLENIWPEDREQITVVAPETYAWEGVNESNFPEPEYVETEGVQEVPEELGKLLEEEDKLVTAGVDYKAFETAEKVGDMLNRSMAAFPAKFEDFEVFNTAAYDRQVELANIAGKRGVLEGNFDFEWANSRDFYLGSTYSENFFEYSEVLSGLQ